MTEPGSAVASSVSVLVAGGAGSGSKVTSTENTGSPPGHVPPPVAPPLEPDTVELCRVTSLTPLTRRRRTSICATTVGALAAQPASVKVGVAPAGVAEVAEAEVAAAAVGVPFAGVAEDEPDEAAEEGEEEGEDGLAAAAEELAPPLAEEPTVASSELSDTSVGSTRHQRRARAQRRRFGLTALHLMVGDPIHERQQCCARQPSTVNVPPCERRRMAPPSRCSEGDQVDGLIGALRGQTSGDRQTVG